ncbi:MAG: hypothetical protein KAT79_00025 [candidate division Zixibacteria bacterium]|nr:hypothetical protein [candidate division Zixibacteria bacterium]
MKNFRYILSAILLTILIASLAAPGLSAKSYVSLKGGFHIQIPDNWSQLDYNTVDAFLYRNRADRATMSYEAAFTVNDLVPFYTSTYLILDVDTAGNFSNEQVDSVLNVLAATFGKKTQYAPVSDLILNLKSNTPTYDAEQRVVTIVNDVNIPDQAPKKNLLIMKFYDRGIASFYFYSPDSLFQNSREMFLRVANSLSTENIEAALPKEELKIVDVASEQEESSSIGIYSALGCSVAVILIIVAARRRRRAGK